MKKHEKKSKEHKKKEGFQYLYQSAQEIQKFNQTVKQLQNLRNQNFLDIQNAFTQEQQIMTTKYLCEKSLIEDELAEKKKQYEQMQAKIKQSIDLIVIQFPSQTGISEFYLKQKRRYEEINVLQKLKPLQLTLKSEIQYLQNKIKVHQKQYNFTSQVRHLRFKGETCKILAQSKTNKQLQLLEAEKQKVLNEFKRVQKTCKNYSDDKSLCIICKQNPKSHTTVPCGHYNFCGRCVEEYKMRECPLCKTEDITFCRLHQ